MRRSATPGAGPPGVVPVKASPKVVHAGYACPQAHDEQVFRRISGSADQQQETVLGAQQQRSSGVAQTARPRRAGEFMNEI